MVYEHQAATRRSRSIVRTFYSSPRVCFTILVASMFVNLFLAFVYARGIPVNSTAVIVIQAGITAFAIPAFLIQAQRIKGSGITVLAFMAFCLIVTNILNPSNFKTFYDIFIIPIYIGLGASARHVRSRWMNGVFAFVVVVTLMEVALPTIYTSVFDPAGYLSATREWLASQSGNDATDAGFYKGAYRAGGAQFAFADHRMSGPFLEPISLGYFAFLMSLYYGAIYRGKFKFLALFICACLALAADSRIPTILILISTLFLSLRLKLPPLVLWLAYPAVVLVAYALYLSNADFLFGDTFQRIAITFGALGETGVQKIIIGSMPLDKIGDSGVIYMLRCVGLFGYVVAAWYYTGCYTRRKGSNVALFTMVSLYLGVSLMFGGATFSIKTASLLGFIVGLAGQMTTSADLREQT